MSPTFWLIYYITTRFLIFLFGSYCYHTESEKEKEETIMTIAASLIPILGDLMFGYLLYLTIVGDLLPRVIGTMGSMLHEAFSKDEGEE